MSQAQRAPSAPGGPPSTPSWRSWWPVGLVALAGLALTLTAFEYVRAASHERLVNHFERETGNLAMATRQRLARYTEALHSLADYFDAEGQVSREAFQGLSRGLLERHPGIRALEWVPVVKASERAAFEAAARREGLTAFRLTDDDPAGRLQPAPPREVYYPVFFIQPFAGNERALGYAPRVHPRNAAIEQARDSGKPAATGRFEPVQPARARYAVAVFAPLYRTPGTPPTLAARRQQIRGFIEGVFVLGEMLDEPLAEARAAGLAVSLTDESAAPAERLLLATASAPEAPGEPALKRDMPLETAGRRWLLSFSLADPRAFEGDRGPGWLVLLGGLLATGLLSGYLSSALNQRRRVERLVHERTRSLRRETERAETYLDVAAVMILMLDPQGRVTLINRRGSEILGWPQAEILGADWFARCVPAREREGRRARFEALLAGRDASAFTEGGLVTRTGEERLMVWHGSVLRDEAGAPVGFLCSGSDVTDYKRAVAEVAAREAELIHAQELDRLRDHLTHAVSHDLRAPLTSIMGYAEFLDEELAGPLTPRQRAYVGQITRGARRLDHLVDDLLDFARLDAGKLQVRREPADLADTLRAVTTMLEPQSHAAGVTLALALESPELPGAFDAERLERVVTNLVHNALKFTPPGGTVRLAARRAGPRLYAEVADTGPGIPEAEQDRLFQRFSQLEGGQRKGGTGLGLSIAKAIVEAHGGRIGVRSAAGQGALFWFEIPAG